MKKILLIIFALAAFAGCELLIPDHAPDNNGNIDIQSKDTVYRVTEDIEPFESMFVSTSGHMVAVKKDSVYSYAVYMDSVAVNEQSALVAFVDSYGRICKLYQNGETIGVTYGPGNSLAITFINDDGELETITDTGLTSRTALTKAGNVLDPYDIFSAANVAKDAGEILTGLAKNKKFNTELTLKSCALAEQIAAFPFGNTATAVGLGAISVLMANPAGFTVAVILGILDIANAAISDWQDIVAELYFGTSTPVTGDAEQLTDRHFVISYSVTDVPSYITDFNVGVIIADGMLITKNHHLLKQTVPYTSGSGHMIVNIGNLNKKKGDRLKYRIFLESQSDNAWGAGNEDGVKLDDELLDYWRYGSVKEFEIAEPALSVTSVKQTGAEDNNGHNYLFDFDVTVTNGIPCEVDEWGVAIYETFSETCESSDDLIDSGRAHGQGNKTFSFNVNISEVLMNTDVNPHTPLINHFAVPYVSFDRHTYGLFENAVEISLAYEEKERPTPGQWVDLGLPSGILWAAWNVGASRPEEYGGYFSWGETEEKKVYSFETYAHQEKYYYDNDDFYIYYKHIGDNISGTQYDVATVRWGGGARMPTWEESQELRENCSWNFGYFNGVAGNFGIGPNGNSIFLPHADFRSETDLYGPGAYYWTGTYNDVVDGWSAYYFWGTEDWLRPGCDREDGLTVRPVKD